MRQLVDEDDASKPPLIILLILDAVNDDRQDKALFVFLGQAFGYVGQLRDDLVHDLVLELFIMPLRLEELLVDLLDENVCEPLVPILGQYALHRILEVELMAQLLIVVVATAVPTLLRVIALAVAHVSVLHILAIFTCVLILYLLKSLLEVLILWHSLLFIGDLLLGVPDQVFDEQGHVVEQEDGVLVVDIGVDRLVAVVAFDQAWQKIFHCVLYPYGLGYSSNILQELPFLKVGDKSRILRPRTSQLFDI